MNTCDVAVVGAGSVGVAAALAFARAGRQVVLVDPRPAAVRPGGVSGVAPGGDPDDWDSRVFALSPASIRLLDGLGVWSAMDMDRVAPVYDMRLYHDQDGGDVQESLRLDAWQGQIERLACIVEGRHLQAALDLVAADAGRTLRLQRVQGTVSALSLAEGQPARLTLDHGEVWEAGLVVAADGARSALRDMAGLESRTYDYGQIAVVANFNSSLPTRDAAWQWFDADLGVMALLPLPAIGRPAGQGRVSLVWSAPVEWAQSLAAMSGDELAAQVARQSRGALGELQCITPAACFPLRSVSCPRVIAPGFVMIGDAAHVVHPMAGQAVSVLPFCAPMSMVRLCPASSVTCRCWPTCWRSRRWRRSGVRRRHSARPAHPVLRGRPVRLPVPACLPRPVQPVCPASLPGGITGCPHGRRCAATNGHGVSR